jgi:hypothetical protein
LAQDVVRLAWPGVGTFTIRGTRTVDIQRAPGVPAEVVRQFLAGPVSAALLRQRGFLVLHASAVTFQGAAIAFLGASGWGKSTLAAALHRRGHRLITDDIAAIDTAGTPSVLAGLAHVKLWPDSVTSLGQNAATLPRVHPQLEKRLQAVERPPLAGPIPLSRVYVLAQAPTPEIEPLAPGAALVELLRHSYGPRTLQHVRREEHFRQCSRLASAIPVAHLRVPRDFTRLDDVVSLIERHCADAP